MILHAALFTWRHDVSPEDVAELTRRLEALPAVIPSLRSYHCGQNLRLRPSDADFVVTAVVDDEEGLTAYLDSAAHQAVYEELLGGMIEHRQAAQLDIGQPGAN